VSTYLTWLASELRSAGCTVVEYSGWQTRARSSGGFSALPLCVMWHHTASNTTPANDASYMCNGSSDRPIANILVARTGEVWVLAAGATNTNGKGGPLTFSRGQVPLDGMNTRAVGCEIANNGVGEQYPQAQIDAMFKVSNAINRRLGNLPTDLASHNLYAPSRKIDPATTNVAGPWRPTSCTSSGTWSTDSIRTEATARSGSTPPPPDQGDDDMLFLIEDPRGGWYVTDGLTGRKAVPTVDVGYDGIDKGMWRGAGRAPIQLDVNGWQNYLDALPLIDD
jgi:hypothetical protein